MKDRFEEILDEIYGEVEICGMTFSSGYALRELDLTAFRCSLADAQDYEDVYICPICGEEHTDEQDALECCQDVYECPICGEQYDNEEDAESCCYEEDDEDEE